MNSSKSLQNHSSRLPLLDQSPLNDVVQSIVIRNQANQSPGHSNRDSINVETSEFDNVFQEETSAAIRSLFAQSQKALIQAFYSGSQENTQGKGRNS